MRGIDLNEPIVYKHASLRYFKEGEYHISRLCKDDVLLLVYDGVLRFCEDGTQYEIHPGQYHIQKQESLQTAPLPSDAPKYLYVHFQGTWRESGSLLARSGTFSCAALMPLMEELDALAHSGAPYVIQTGKFYALLSHLYGAKPEDSPVRQMADYLARGEKFSLEKLCREFHFSKNHIINLFKKEFGMTPVRYANSLRLRKAEYLIEVTSEPLEAIAVQCGFPNYSYFYKLFRREHGLSPDAWREKKRIE